MARKVSATAPSTIAESEGATPVKPNAQMLVGKGWFQGVALVMLFGFFVMGILAYRTYTDSMPLPKQVVAENGDVLFTQEDIEAGQQIFTSRGLQEYGSVVGHGAYLGPDFTADYLRRATDNVAEQLGGKDVREQVVKMFRNNTYDEKTATITYTPEQVKAYEDLVEHYTQYFGPDAKKNGLTSDFITDKAQIRELTSFFSWTAWASAAERPDKSYSYTNNWPAEPRVDNTPTADMLVWSALSLIVLVGGTGIMFAIYGRWSRKIGWHSEEAPAINYRQPGEVGLTPGQRVTAWFFFAIAALFVIQVFLGALTEHYRADLSNFFGIDLAELLPFNLARTWHLQLSLFWTAGAFLAAGIFLAPFIARREPKGQAKYVWILLGAVVLVVLGSLTSEALSIHGVDWAKGPLFEQQWEYLDLPFIYQILLTAGMFIWIVIVYRTIRGRLKGENKGNMPWLFFFSALSIPAFYAVGLLARPTSHLSVAEFWRFWVVHLWVEDFL